jgi:hypothetical protein
VPGAIEQLAEERRSLAGVDGAASSAPPRRVAGEPGPPGAGSGGGPASVRAAELALEAARREREDAGRRSPAGLLAVVLATAPLAALGPVWGVYKTIVHEDHGVELPAAAAGVLCWLIAAVLVLSLLAYVVEVVFSFS